MWFQSFRKYMVSMDSQLLVSSRSRGKPGLPEASTELNFSSFKLSYWRTGIISMIHIPFVSSPVFLPQGRCSIYISSTKSTKFNTVQMSKF